MTDLSPVKAMLVTALEESSTGQDIFFRNPDAPSYVIHVGDFDDADRQIEIDADRLAATVLSGVTALVLDREKVKAVLLSILEDVDVSFDNQGFEITKYFHDEDGTLFIGCDPVDETDGPVKEAFTTGLIPIDDLIAHLIAALAGGQS